MKYESGQVFKTFSGCEYEIVEVVNMSNIKCKFKDSYGYEFITNKARIKSGEIKNPYLPILYGVGYLGVGVFKTNSKHYRVWLSMIKRCHGKITKDNIGKTICEEWFNFQTFAEWYENSSAEGKFAGTLQPKDLVFSPSSCKFVVKEKKQTKLPTKPYNRLTITAGDKFTMNSGEVVEVVEYIDHLNVMVKFTDFPSKVFKTTSKGIKNRALKSPFSATNCNIGNIGFNKHSDDGSYKDIKSLISHRTWKSMINRCYNTKSQSINYVDCTVSEEWLDYSNFKDWWDSQYKEVGWNIDKDILVTGNKVYSEATCCLVPRDINMLIIKRNASRGELPIGVTRDKDKFKAQFSCLGKTVHLGLYDNIEDAFLAYKEAKKSHIEYMVELYGKVLRQDVKEALLTYEINIDD